MKLVVKFLIVLSSFVVLLSQLALGWRSYEILIIAFPYEFNADYMEAQIQLQRDADGSSSIDMVWNFLKDIDDVYLQVVVALEANEGNFTEAINRSVNFCKFLMQRSLEPTLRVFYDDILRQSKFIKQCPIKRGSYALQGFKIDEELLPTYVPEVNFYVDLKLQKEDSVWLFRGRLQGSVDKSKGFENLKAFSIG